VNIAGGFPSQTRILADGSTLADLSQESVQEFQISTFNPDPALGVTGAGVINVLTRRGSNDWHGSALFFYHRGIVFMRLEDERPANKIQVLRRLLESYADRFEDQFIVVTETQVRFGKPKT